MRSVDEEKDNTGNQYRNTVTDECSILGREAERRTKTREL
jgi:hypothetical protein